MLTRDDALALDAADPLARFRDAFDLPEGVIYLDGNSLGPPPKAALARLADAAQRGMGPGPDPELERQTAGSTRRSGSAARSPG